MYHSFIDVSCVIFLKYNMMRQSQSGKRTERLVHVDTTQSDLSHGFQLYIVQPPNACSSDKPIYKLKQVDQPLQHKVGKRQVCIQALWPSE